MKANITKWLANRNYIGNPHVKVKANYGGYCLESDLIWSEHNIGTLLHELVHSTGHSGRLNRTNFYKACNFKWFIDDFSKEIKEEEAIANIGAIFLLIYFRVTNRHCWKVPFKSWISYHIPLRMLLTKRIIRDSIKAIQYIIANYFKKSQLVFCTEGMIKPR